MGEVVMPQMGESIVEGTITKWLKSPGDTVERDEALFEISTDKVDSEVPAPDSGVLEAIFFPEGDTVEINTVVAFIGGRFQGRQARCSCRRLGAAGAPTEACRNTRSGAAAPPADGRADCTGGARHAHSQFSAGTPDCQGTRNRPGGGWQRHRRGRPHHQEGHPRVRGEPGARAIGRAADDGLPGRTRVPFRRIRCRATEQDAPQHR